MSTRRDFLTQTAVACLGAAISNQLGQAAAHDASAGAKTPLKTYNIPNTDLVVSRLAYGCAMLGWDWDSPDFVEKTVPMINVAYEQGITFFDLADVYGHGKAEMALGQVLKQRPSARNNIVIQSKCGDRFAEGKGSVDNGRRYIESSVEGSLERLGTEHLDILLLHWPDSLVEPQEVAHAFDRLQRSGKVRYFGVSNHSPHQIEILKKAVRQPLVANQIQLGLAYWFVTPDPSLALLKSRFNHGAEGVTTLDYCRAHDIPVQAYSPLRGGYAPHSPNLLSPTPNASAEVKTAAQLLANIAKEHDTVPAAVMLAWLLRHPAGIVPIMGGLRPEHVVENCAADRIELSHDDWYSLLQAAATMQAQQPT